MLVAPRLCAGDELTMLAWYGHAEPDIVAEFEAENNVKFKPKYYTGGDNMLGLISQVAPRHLRRDPVGRRIRPALNAAGYVEELDPADYALDDYFPEFQQFPATGRTASSSRWSPASASSVSPTTPTP
jgi:spermidine/putrescine transport system substrate-binding protein